ncbi:hypothetical protein BJ875DRAFT_249157 [Amylocarpus encephaloides]|uniref:CENP-V/GFA domain-containing protein n=1 Tax=Amylocarpus encephaloides TaxID=45428 RepID=A0A9P7YMJ4_9HELO|nr:hypothetical protein BJ875DRAFT_249157 [Amylocarpus encephaloides]
MLTLPRRPTASGNVVNHYFCKACGTRLIHTTPDKDIVSVKGGCIEGLDWNSARHIWCKRALVPIPEGVERDDEEPKVESHETIVSNIMSMLSGSGGSVEGEEKRQEGPKGKTREYRGVPIREDSQRSDDIEVLKISLEATVERQRELGKIKDFPRESTLNSWDTLDSGATATLSTMLERRLKQLAQEKGASLMH